VIEVLKIMYLALFFSGCNHYKSVHFAFAKIQKISDITKTKGPTSFVRPFCFLFRLVEDCSVFLAVAAKAGANPLAVEASNVLTFDLLGALGLAGVGVGAGTKTEFVHLADHLTYAVGSFNLALRQECEVAHLGTYEQHGTGVFAGRHAGSAADAGGGIHGHVGFVFGNEDAVGIGHATGGGTDVAAALDDFVEGGAVDHKVADDREGFGSPRLNPNVVAVIELAHVKLTSGDTVVVAVGTAVDVEATHAADALAAVIVETDGVGNVVVEQTFVQDIEHLQKGALGGDIFDLVGLEMALGTGILLTPYM